MNGRRQENWCAVRSGSKKIMRDNNKSECESALKIKSN
jgi:hypothetical protein